MCVLIPGRTRHEAGAGAEPAGTPGSRSDTCAVRHQRRVPPAADVGARLHLGGGLWICSENAAFTRACATDGAFDLEQVARPSPASDGLTYKVKGTDRGLRSWGTGGKTTLLGPSRPFVSSPLRLPPPPGRGAHGTGCWWGCAGLGALVSEMA